MRDDLQSEIGHTLARDLGSLEVFAQLRFFVVHLIVVGQPSRPNLGVGEAGIGHQLRRLAEARQKGRNGLFVPFAEFTRDLVMSAQRADVDEPLLARLLHGGQDALGLFRQIRPPPG